MNLLNLWHLACPRAAGARQRAVAAIAALALVSIIGTARALAQHAYITNYLDGTSLESECST